MDSTYRPRSPDLSSYAPQSPDLSGLRPQSPDLSGLASPHFGQQTHHHQYQHQHQHPSRFGGALGGNGFGGPMSYQPTSVPQETYYEQQYQQPMMIPQPDDEWMPDAAAPSKRNGKGAQHSSRAANGNPLHHQDVKPATDPTLGVNLKTSFPVARIKRIMQADEDIGKVAQVTPHVVSRALELFMIKLIAASADQARASGGGGASKGPRKILAQHMKKAIMEDENFDFLGEIVAKVPDAPSKAAAAKKEKDSESEEEKEKKPVKKRGGRKRKESSDD